MACGPPSLLRPVARPLPASWPAPCSCRCSQQQQEPHIKAHRQVHDQFVGAARTPWQVLGQALQKAACSSAATGLSLALLATAWQPPPAAALTVEQQFFLEAWRAVDRAFYDKKFNGQSWFKVRESYLKGEPMSTHEETYLAIRKAIASLDDPFTRLVPPKQYQALKRTTAGRPIVGVGLEVGFKSAEDANSAIVVVAPSSGSPAEAAGIQPRESLLAINAQPTAGMSLYDVSDLLQGTDGSQVTLTLQPEDGSPRQVQLNRRPINTDPVSSRLCGARRSSGAPATDAGQSAPQGQGEGGLGYIRISTFSKTTGEGVRAAIRQLKAEGASRYVVDIRNNGGGLFPAGVDVAKMWLDSGDIVLIADGSGVRDSYEADGTALEARAPLAVLVNHGTASASEVLAGALQDNKRATIVGETTFGKGLIQTIVELSDGSAVVITAARYRTPAGTDINKVGISPDVELQAQAQPPLEGAGFCRFAGPQEVQRLFAKAPAKPQPAAQVADASSRTGFPGGPARFPALLVTR